MLWCAVILKRGAVLVRFYSEEVLCVQVKLSGQSGRKADVVWTESGLLFTATGEQVIRWVHTQMGSEH